MSDYFDRIERHLLDAVERNASTSRPRWRLVDRAGHWWARRMLNTSTVLAAVLVVVSVSVAGVFLTSVHSTRRPSSGTVSANQECGAKAAQRLSRGAPPESVLSVLGVLRRPQAPTDRPPARFAPGVLGGGSTLIPRPPAAVLRLDGLPPSAQIASGSLYAYSRYVRRARGFAGGSDYLIPMAGAVTLARSDRCSHPYFAGVKLHELHGGAGFGGCCYDVSEILAGRASSESGDGGRTFLTLLVPDRVAEVTVYVRAGQGPRTTIRTKPVGNVVSVILPISSLQAPFSVHSVWHSASGRIIKSVR